MGTGTRAMAYFYKIYSSTHLNYLTLLIYIELAVAFETRVQRYTVSATSQRQLCITFLIPEKEGQSGMGVIFRRRLHQSEVNMAIDTAPITEHGVAILPEQAWEHALYQDTSVNIICVTDF